MYLSNLLRLSRELRISFIVVVTMGLSAIILSGGAARARDYSRELPLRPGARSLHESSAFDSVRGPLDGPIEGSSSIAAQSQFHRILVPPQTDGTAQYFYDMYGNAGCEVHLPGPAFGDGFYPNSAILADINDDGKDDIILASHQYDPPARTDAGAVLVFFGRTGIFPDTLNPADADLKIYGRADGDRFGMSVCAGDFNGDSKTDLLVGADLVTNPAAVGEHGGGAMMFFGRTTWPSVWDLSSIPDSADHEFYGMDAWVWWSQTGTAVAAGDVDGDGIDEAIIFSPSAPAPGARNRVSNTWIFKGRSSLSWPSRVIELWSDLGAHTFAYTFGALLYGVDSIDAWIQTSPNPSPAFDFRINNVTCDDINGDGKDDIMIAFWGADGPSNTGLENGEVRILYGYAGLGTFNGSYPDTFNLATQSNAVIYGEDNYDRMSRVYAADLIGNDNIKDVVVTSRQGAGPGNSRTRGGEAYVIQGKPSLNSLYQMPGNADVTIYGAEAYDRMEYAVPWTGPYGGIILGISTGDGPFNQRTDCGELKWIDRNRFDALTLPAAIDLALFEVMTYGFGSAANDWMTYAGQMAVGDVDGNGYPDILAPSPVMCQNPPTCSNTLGKATLINGTTFGNSDIDGDAVDGLCDNCPNAYNPLQDDGDGDGVPTGCDNCPATANPTQADADFDNTGDACDLDPTSFVGTAPVPSLTIKHHIEVDFDHDGYTDMLYNDGSTGIYIAWGPNLSDLPSHELVALSLGANSELNYDFDGWYYSPFGPSYHGPRFYFTEGNNFYLGRYDDPRSFFILGWPYKSSAAASENGKPAALQAPEPTSLTSGYFNANAKPDVLIPPSYLLLDVDTAVAPVSVSMPFAFDAVAAGDFNSDGNEDALVVRGDSVHFYTNNGLAAFAKTASVLTGTPASGVPVRVLTGDFDGDGDWDGAELLAYNDSAFSALLIIYGNGAGGVQSTERLIIQGTATSVERADANKDGREDFVITNSSLGQIEIFGQQKFGGYDGPLVVALGVGTGLPFAVSPSDINRDGNVDFVTSSSAIGGVTVSTNQSAALPVIADDLRVLAYDNASVAVANPLNNVISSVQRTIASSYYSRSDVNGNGKLDDGTTDWNAMYGWYTITAKRRANAPVGSTYSVVISIDGSQQLIAADKLTSGGNSVSVAAAEQNAATDSVVFHFLLEANPTISPAFGTNVTSKRPLFSWTGRKNAAANFYELQVDENLSFSTPRVSSPTLSFPAYQPTVDLGLDSVFYWRWREQIGGVWQAWKHPIPVKIVCCVALTGNADCDPTDGVDISDLASLIDYLYISFTPLCCMQEGNVDGSSDGNIDIADLSALIDYLYISFTPPSGCQ